MADHIGMSLNQDDLSKIPDKKLQEIEALLEEVLEKNYGKGIWKTLETVALVEETLRNRRHAAQQKFLKGKKLSKQA